MKKLVIIFVRKIRAIYGQREKIRLIYELVFKRISFKKLLHMVRFFLKSIVLKKRLPVAVIMGLTYRCQCQCVHCSVDYYKNLKQEELTLVQIKNVIDQIVTYGIPKINFFGGEPLLKSGIVELVSYAYRKGLSVSIDTNGLLLEDSLVEGLNKAGINNINVSLDSADPEIHDSLRHHQGVFYKAVNGIKLCVKRKIPCVLSTYASKRAVASGDLEKLIKLGRQLNVTAVKILLPLMAGRWFDKEEELLSVWERQLVYELVEPGFVYIESPFFNFKNGRKVCEALDKKIVYIAPDGQLQICHTVPFSFGKVKDQGIGNLITQMWSSIFFKSIDNDCDCPMNNHKFLSEYSILIKEANRLPIDVEKIKKM